MVHLCYLQNLRCNNYEGKLLFLKLRVSIWLRFMWVIKLLSWFQTMSFCDNRNFHDGTHFFGDLCFSPIPFGMIISLQ